MKKTFSLSLLFALCISILLATASCSAKHPIEEFKNKMDTADSYQITMTMSNVPFIGTYTMTIKVDGNISYVPETLINEEEYAEVVGDIAYSYKKNSYGKWKKTQYSLEDYDSLYDDQSMENLFNPEKFEKAEDKENTYYKQKKDTTFDDFEDVVITINENSCTIETKCTEDGITFDVKIVLSKIGEIELTLPTVE